jgi:quinol monooxygenase YgiN
VEKQQSVKGVKVVARITARPDRIDELTRILLRLVEETRKEKGCLSYELYQNLDEPNDFTVVEDWASNAAIDSHMVTEHVQDAKAGSRRRLKSKDTGPLDNCEQRKAR